MCRRLLAQRFGLAVGLLGMTTRGDQILDRTLSKVGGKGLFVKELETALEDGRAHLAVHSLKDVPMDLPDGFELAAVLEREDPRDAFVSTALRVARRAAAGRVRRHLEPAPRGAAARAAARPARASRCAATSTRGCASSTKASYDAIVLAAAGLMRLGLADAHRAPLRTRGDAAVRRPGRARHRGAQPTPRRCARSSPS